MNIMMSKVKESKYKFSNNRVLPRMISQLNNNYHNDKVNQYNYMKSGIFEAVDA